MDREFPLTARAVNPYESGLTLEHVDDEPRTFHSRKELEKFCTKKGLSAKVLE